MRSIREELDHTPLLGDVNAAVRSASKRRQSKKRSIATMSVVGTAAAAAAIIVSTSVLPRAGDQPPNEISSPTGSQSEQAEKIQIGEGIRDWAPATRVVGTPVPAGAVIARTCEGSGECEWVFVTSDSQTLPVNDVSKGLAELLANVDPASVSLSFDGQWLSIDQGDTIRLQSLNPKVTTFATIEPSGAGSAWDVVAWGGGSLSVSMVESDSNGRVINYGAFDLLGTALSTTRAPEPAAYGPINVLGIGVQVGQRYAPDERATTYETLVVPIADDSLPEGEITPLSDRPTELTGLLGPDETLASDSGLLEVRTPPSNDDEVWPVVTVFSDSSNTVQRTGVIEVRSDTPRRVVSAEDGWTLLGAAAGDTVVESGSTPDGSRIRARSIDGEIAWSHTINGTVDWVVPGVTDE